MVTEKPIPASAGLVVRPAATSEPQKPRTTSLDEVVKRHKHVRAIHPHPSQTPVPLDQRIVRTAAAKTIVVVDDEPDQVDLTVMVLEAAGHTAHGTTEGQAAVGLVIEQIADLLVVDFMMPNMNGAAIGKALRAHPSCGKTKIVILSGTSEEVVRADFDQFEVFLQKPVHPDRLLRTVEDL